MTFNQDKWIAAMKKAKQDLPSSGPSDGIVCALATIRVIRDGICDDIGENNEEDKQLCESIRLSCKELIGSLGKSKLAGFASNASAAAKAAKLEGVASVLTMPEE